MQPMPCSRLPMPFHATKGQFLLIYISYVLGAMFYVTWYATMYEIVFCF